jgi:iron uptake system component EfeO
MPSRLVMRLAVGASALLVLVAAGAFYFASETARQRPAGPEGIAVTVTAAGCEPNALTASAGRTPFTVRNGSQRALEWEILDGVMVVAERENIAPGLTATLAPRLEAGTYAITCGLLSNPRGTLTVLPSGDAPPAAPDLAAFIGPLAEMQVYLSTGSAGFTDAASALRQAIAGGNLDAARAAYARASAAYARIEPAARRFADLGAAIDGTAAYLAGREADPAFTGLHRIAYGLFIRVSLDGLAPVASRLLADAGALAERLASRTPDPAALAGDAADWLAAASQTVAAGDRDAYAGNDLADLGAALESVRKSIDLTVPLGKATAGDEVRRVETAWAALTAAIEAQRGPHGFPTLATLPADVRAALAADLGALGEALASLNDRIESAGVAA